MHELGWIHGSLNYFTMEELEHSDTDNEKNADDSNKFSELEGDKLLQSLQYQGEWEQAAIEASSICQELHRTITKTKWKKAESSKWGVYSGNSSLINILPNG